MTGMVLQAGNIGEYDKRIVLLTKERGRISAFARGAKKATSQYAAACQPFTFGEFSLYEGKNSFNLMWAGVDNYFDTLKKAIFSVYSGETYIEPSLMPLLNSSLAERDVLKEKGIDMLDAPVSGGEPKAIDGTVAFMVGGDEKTFDKYKQILTHMGSSVTRCGELGAGNTTKLANQIIVACNIQAVSESFILAKKAGVDPECVFEAIKGGLAGSTVMNAKVPMMIEDNVEPGFRVDLHIKDLNNALECAHSVGAPVPMTAQVQEIMQYLHNNGDGSSDHSAIIHYYEKLADTKL